MATTSILQVVLLSILAAAASAQSENGPISEESSVSEVANDNPNASQLPEVTDSPTDNGESSDFSSYADPPLEDFKAWGDAEWRAEAERSNFENIRNAKQEKAQRDAASRDTLREGRQNCTNPSGNEEMGPPSRADYQSCLTPLKQSFDEALQDSKLSYEEELQNEFNRYCNLWSDYLTHNTRGYEYWQPICDDLKATLPDLGELQQCEKEILTRAVNSAAQVIANDTANILADRYIPGRSPVPTTPRLPGPVGNIVSHIEMTLDASDLMVEAAKYATDVYVCRQKVEEKIARLSSQAPLACKQALLYRNRKATGSGKLQSYQCQRANAVTSPGV